VAEQKAKAAELQQEALKAEVQEGEQVVAQERTKAGQLEKSLVDADTSCGSTNLKACSCCCASDTLLHMQQLH